MPHRPHDLRRLTQLHRPHTATRAVHRHAVISRDITLDLDTEQLLFHVAEDPATVKATDVFPIAVRGAADAAGSEHGRPVMWLDDVRTGVSA